MASQNGRMPRDTIRDHTYTDDGQRLYIYEHDTETGEVIYRTPAGPLVKKLSETGFGIRGARGE